MISSEVQRTLVKSPPELWAELSDPVALARHLGELGEIRITRVEPEQKVEWEAGETSGTVSIKPSGWGTKVKLTVTRELAEPDASAPDEDSEAPEPKSAPGDDPQSETIEPAAPPEPELRVAPRTLIAPTTHEGSARGAGHQAQPAAGAVEITAEREPERAEAPTPRRGFFARLFGRRRAAQPEPESSDETRREDDDATGEPAHEPYNALAAWAPPIESEPQPEAEAEPQSEPAATAEPQRQQHAEEHVPPAGQPSDADEPTEPEANSALSEEIRADEEVTAVLTGVLDRLGEAHHRPFSRS